VATVRGTAVDTYEEVLMAPMRSKSKPWLVTAAIVAGAAVGATGVASAATSSPPATAAGGAGGATRPPNPAAVTHGPGETLLSGTDLIKARSAALGAVPGATVIRAETDSSGAATYEVHLRLADGTYETVQLDASFAVKATVKGFGPPPPGAASRGMAPLGAAPGPR